MKKVFICSPLKGNNDCPKGRLHSTQIVTDHIEIARKLCKAILILDQILPVAPHLYFPQFLDDSDPAQRQIGCMLGLAMLRECSGMIVYKGCCGISEGMHAEIKEAEKLDIEIRYIDNLDYLYLLESWALDI